MHRQNCKKYFLKKNGVGYLYHIENYRCFEHVSAKSCLNNEL